ncbi:Shikimate dehydrogenase [Paraliobacillus sp. PM-2]|uniref:shikimate dehydrogenase n=1 Tax=Paraliobacillus sp. PM-2 TaxID=1462524 RepID=UPI00061C86B8|nr:shikimate dehydrogenase [Paraliobacillus sp. PM-2]CQR46915.1 Shikimate dehydrogenase [Paraliobacillus sp. PM-2]
MKLGLIGYPIKHSLSPWIHKQFLQQINQKGQYKLYETSDIELPETIEKIKQDDLRGYNVTVPYKQAIIPYLDELDIYAEKIGAVNTVVCDNGKWIGYNTDGLGYIQAVKADYPELFTGKKNVLVIGAGGAARGIFYALCQESFERVDIANRTIEKAMTLKSLNQTKQVKTNCVTFEEAEKNIDNYHLIIQTTSVGMNEDVAILSLDNLLHETVVSDIVYQPLLTTFLREARDQGAKIHQGHTMLLNQAKLAFQKWTGKKVSVNPLRYNLEQQLKKDE